MWSQNLCRTHGRTLGEQYHPEQNEGIYYKTHRIVCNVIWQENGTPDKHFGLLCSFNSLKTAIIRSKD